MKFTERYAKLFRYFLPTPFTIALLLTIVTYLLALFLTKTANTTYANYSLELLGEWENGLWQDGLMVFAMQMMLMLVLGHVLALSPPMDRFISMVVGRIRTNAEAALWVSFLTILVALFNWGLGLIFGAIFARKVAEKSIKSGLNLNYPLIGAAGYVGLMVWHGGLSGSSLAKVAEIGHLREMMSGIYNETQLSQLPEQITFSETVFSNANLYSCLMLFLLIPALFYWLGKQKFEGIESIDLSHSLEENNKHEEDELIAVGAERLDRSRIFAYSLGFVIILYALYKAFSSSGNSMGFITPDYINFFLLGMSVLMHGNFNSFLSAVDKAIGGASGILIQFPLYFGIMALMRSSGMVEMFSGFFVEISTQLSFPIYTLFSAGIVNIFVPSGGGEITKNFETIEHRYPMLSLSNSYSREEIEEFDERVKKILGREVEYVCELKYDGVAIGIKMTF